MIYDDHFLEVIDIRCNLLEELYLGKFQNNTIFSLRKWRFQNGNNDIYIKYYMMKERYLDGDIIYSVLSDEMINEIENFYLNNIPITQIENNDYDEMKNFISIINGLKVRYKYIDIYFVLRTERE